MTKGRANRSGFEGGSKIMKYRAKAVMSIEELNFNGIEHENGWVTGWLIEDLITGDVSEVEDGSITPDWWTKVDKATISPFLPKEEYQSKHEAFNLQYKEDEVFKDVCVIVDQSDIPVLWIKKETGKVSFGGRYFHLYREQRLIEVLDEFGEIAFHFVNEKNHEHIDFAEKFKKALEEKKELEMEFFKKEG